MNTIDLLPSACRSIGEAILSSYPVGTHFTASDFQSAVHDAYQGPNKNDIMPCGYGGLRTKHTARWVLNKAKHNASSIVDLPEPFSPTTSVLSLQSNCISVQ